MPIQIDNKKLITILISGIAMLAFLTLVLILRNFGGNDLGPRINLEFWGIFDDRSSLDGVIRDFQAKNPNITVSYRQFSYEDYEREVLNALAGGGGPDVWMIHHTWLPKHIDKLSPLNPNTKGIDEKPLMTFRDFQEQFVEVAVSDLTRENQIYAVPLYVDTLALYYNKDLFNNAGITSPPSNWQEFNEAVEKLTKIDSSGNITQAGAAIGTSQNINRSTDILSALMIQSGVRMTDIDNTEAIFARSVNNTPVGEIALRYYSDFANPAVRTYTWNNGQHYSIDAFSEGSVGMMFNYSHQASVLSQKSARLNYGIAPMPQVNESDIKNYANYLAVAVSKNSQYPDLAWRFASYFASRDGASRYLADTMRPSARRDLIDLQKNDLRLGIFANQALTAKSWYQPDNSAIELIFADMINSVNQGRLTIRDALQEAESKVNVLMARSNRSR